MGERRDTEEEERNNLRMDEAIEGWGKGRMSDWDGKTGEGSEGDGYEYQLVHCSQVGVNSVCFN